MLISLKRLGLLVALAVPLLVHCAGLASAASSCKEILQSEQPSGTLTRETGSEPIVMKMKGLICSAEDSDQPLLRIRVDRISDPAATHLMMGLPAPMVGTDMASAKVFETNVAKVFKELFSNFGGKSQPSVETGATLRAGSRSEGSEIALKTDDDSPAVSHVVSPFTFLGDFPLPSDSHTLLGGFIPDGFHYYYDIECGDGGTSRDSCSAIDGSEMFVWRSLTQGDIDNFRSNLEVANREFPDQYFVKERVANPYLALINRLSGNSLPPDLLFVTGTRSGTCAAPDRDFWIFTLHPRRLVLETVLLTNVSDERVYVRRLLGAMRDENTLRDTVLDQDVLETVAEPSVSLSPGESLLVPVRILLPPPERLTGRFHYASTARELAQSKGTGNLGKDRAQFGVPEQKTYVYGPEIAFGDVEVQRADRNPFQVASLWDSALGWMNEIDISFEQGLGSCPYLMSRSTTDHHWTDYGKVLHRAKGKRQEATETRRVHGFHGEFRLEEREAEVAYIDEARLTVTLRDGAKLVLRPDIDRLVQSDGRYLQLLWGQAAIFKFKLPDGVKEDGVVHSEIALTGYYHRYSTILPRRKPVPKMSVSPTKLQDHAAACQARVLR